jgi:hypothetical protein
MAELTAIVLEFKHERDTKRASLFQEELGERQWSDQDVAVGPLYVKQQALELIGSPKKLKVTIEPIM